MGNDKEKLQMQNDKIPVTIKEIKSVQFYGSWVVKLF